MNPIFVMIPTYNEADNIRSLVLELLETDPWLHVLVVDDDSPDGTHRIVHELASSEPRVHLLHRTSRRGRGYAGIDGFLRALEMGASAVVEMDGDHSHAPRDLPSLLGALEGADLVIGSRRLEGGQDSRSQVGRRVLSRLAGTWIRLWLGVPVTDPTSGYRAFRSELLRRLNLSALRSPRPSILEEMLLAAVHCGARIREVPIRFEPRRTGRSKLALRTILRVMVDIPLVRLGLTNLLQ